MADHSSRERVNTSENTCLGGSSLERCWGLLGKWKYYFSLIKKDQEEKQCS